MSEHVPGQLKYDVCMTEQVSGPPVRPPGSLSPSQEGEGRLLEGLQHSLHRRTRRSSGRIPENPK